MNDWYKPNYSINKQFKIFIITIIALLALTLVGVVFCILLNFGVINFNSYINTEVTAEDVLPDNYKDYLNSLYTSTQTDSADIDIPAYDGTVNFKLSTAGTSKENLSLQELYERCSPWIVSISASKDGENYSYWGSGIVISSDGLILTNTHIIDGCKAAYVQLYDKTKYDVSFVAADLVSDLALLKIETDTELDYAQFADSTSVEVGDEVAAIGCPLGDTFRNTLTNGIISAIERGISYNGHIMTLLQTNTALNEGNSGGALFNMSGQIIGITNMKMMSYYSSIEGIAFAIPSSTIETIINDLIPDGTVERTSIGIVAGSIPENILKHYELPKGVYVSTVIENSGAEKAGIQEGDIITKVEGEDVSSVTDINAIKDKLNSGDELHMTIYRDGDIKDVTVILELGN